MRQTKKILVVDDEPQITRSLAARLLPAAVMKSARPMMATAAFAPRGSGNRILVITDVSMPNMDGIELCRQLRPESTLPIIVLSVKGEEKAKVEALDAGADDYVTKPVGMDELLARVRRNLARSKPPADSKQQNHYHWRLQDRCGCVSSLGKKR